MKKVLVVEDHPDILESMEIMLQRSHFEVATLKDGSRVFDYASQNHPDIIVMDVMIPPPDGIEVCQTLKSNPGTRDIPVLLLSARTQQDEVAKGYQAGADRYLFKPFLNQDLLKTIEGLLAEREKPLNLLEKLE